MIKLKDPGRKVEIEGHLVSVPCRSSGSKGKPWRRGDACERLIRRYWRIGGTWSIRK